jgi:hypothetical protein
MTLQTKAVLLHAAFSIPSGRKVDKVISDKVADDYNVSGGRVQSGNFNKITIASSYLKPFMTIKRTVEQAIERMTLPYLHENDKMYILPNGKIMDFADVWRKAESNWNSHLLELRTSKYDEALNEARKRLNDQSGGMFLEDDYPSVEKFISKFNIEKFIRPIPDEHSMEFLTSVSELEAASIRKEVKESIEGSMETAKECLFSRIYNEMDKLRSILESDSPRIFEARMERIQQLAKSIKDLNFTDDERLEEVGSIMERELCLSADQLRGDEARQDEVIEVANTVINKVCGYDEIDNTMEKLYGYRS